MVPMQSTFHIPYIFTTSSYDLSHTKMVTEGKYVGFLQNLPHTFDYQLNCSTCI